MTNAQTGTLVLQDARGRYFLVSRATVEQGRVPEQHTAKVEQLIAAAQQSGAGEDDVQGHVLPAVIAGFCIGGYSVLVGHYHPELGQAIDWQGALQQAGG